MSFNLYFYENHKSDQLERYSTPGEIRLTVWAEFGVCRVKALGGVAVRNFSLIKRIIIIRSLNRISVSWLSQANLIKKFVNKL